MLVPNRVREMRLHIRKIIINEIYGNNFVTSLCPIYFHAFLSIADHQNRAQTRFGLAADPKVLLRHHHGNCQDCFHTTAQDSTYTSPHQIKYRSPQRNIHNESGLSGLAPQGCDSAPHTRRIKAYKPEISRSTTAMYADQDHIHRADRETHIESFWFTAWFSSTGTS